MSRPHNPALWVSPAGDDRAAGDASDPLKTAQEALERLDGGWTGRPLVTLLAGVHALDDKLTLRIPGSSGLGVYPPVFEAAWIDSGLGTLAVGAGSSTGSLAGDPVFGQIQLAGSAPTLAVDAHAGDRARFLTGALAGRSFVLESNGTGTLVTNSTLPAAPAPGDTLVLEKRGAIVRFASALAVAPGTGWAIGFRGIEFNATAASAVLRLQSGAQVYTGCKFSGQELFVTAEHDARVIYGGYLAAEVLPRHIFAPDSGDGLAGLGCAFAGTARVMPQAASGAYVSMEFSVVRGGQIFVGDDATLNLQRSAVVGDSTSTGVIVDGGAITTSGVRIRGSSLINPTISVSRTTGKARLLNTNVSGSSGDAILVRDDAGCALQHVYGTGNALWGCNATNGAAIVADPATVQIAGNSGQLRKGGAGGVNWNSIAGVSTDDGSAVPEGVSVRAGV
jgi:hypothetical protein